MPRNTAVFVSGLPPDASPEEVHAAFSRCGIVAEDVRTGAPRVRLYARGDPPAPTGEALVVYLRAESVGLAVRLLDGALLRPDSSAPMRVQPATFPGGEERTPIECPAHKRPRTSDASEGGKGAQPTVDRRTWRARMQRMERRLEWTLSDDSDGTAPDARASALARSGRVLLLEHMFGADEEAQLQAGGADAGRLAADVAAEVADEAARLLGLELPPRVRVHCAAPRPVVSVRLSSAAEAQRLARGMHGRLFDGRVVAARPYDGSFSLRHAVRPAAAAGDDERLERLGADLEAQSD